MPKEYKFTKQCNPQLLLEEIVAAGINLKGADQIGYMNTANDGKDISIVIKDGVSIDVNVLNQTIQNHQYKIPANIEQEKQTKRALARTKLKSLSFTDDEADGIFI